MLWGTPPDLSMISAPDTDCCICNNIRAVIDVHNYAVAFPKQTARQNQTKSVSKNCVMKKKQKEISWHMIQFVSILLHCFF